VNASGMGKFKAHCTNPACGYKRVHSDILLLLKKRVRKAKPLRSIALEEKNARARAKYAQMSEEKKQYHRDRARLWKEQNRDRKNESKRLCEYRKTWPEALIPALEAIYQAKKRMAKNDHASESKETDNE
jgi:hypothetical protein